MLDLKMRQGVACYFLVLFVLVILYLIADRSTDLYSLTLDFGFTWLLLSIPLFVIWYLIISCYNVNIRPRFFHNKPQMSQKIDPISANTLEQALHENMENLDVTTRPELKICPICGTSNDLDHHYCKYCGRLLTM
jgi:ABC-type nickel/cobalt efflux system permease component RcnA